MLTDNHIKEGLSRSYIMAVAHRAGLSFSTRDFDYGVDGSFNDITTLDSRYIESGFTIDFQAKASSNVEFEPDAVVYDLEAKSYKDLISTNRGPRPFILILLAMPADAGEWLQVTPDAMFLRRGAWWASLRGMQPTTNVGTKRIRIPIAQVFDVAAVQELMERHKRGEVF